jgi:hypothetical protein
MEPQCTLGTIFLEERTSKYVKVEKIITCPNSSNGGHI